jgi:isopentenyl-diphosphate delta-isomerase
MYRRERQMEDILILVDEDDRETGTMGKQEAHVRGLKHRAFSIFVFNDRNELLLQRRALDKYHTPGLWTNTCCSHPRAGERNDDAAHRRLQEEMGFDTDLIPVFTLSYRVAFPDGIIENEYDHVFLGRYSGEPVTSPLEVEDHVWLSMEAIREWMEKDPEQFTHWFRLIVSDEVFLSKLEAFLEGSA